MNPTGVTRSQDVPPLWILPESPDPGHVAALSGELGLPVALCALLVQRGFSGADSARCFLRPLLGGGTPNRLFPKKNVTTS